MIPCDLHLQAVNDALAARKINIPVSRGDVKQSIDASAATMQETVKQTPESIDPLGYVFYMGSIQQGMVGKPDDCPYCGLGDLADYFVKKYAWAAAGTINGN